MQQLMKNEQKITDSLFYKLSKSYIKLTKTQQQVLSCEVCLRDNIPFSETILLSCQHRFCKQCLIQDWTLKIKEHKINEQSLICPTVNCNKPISYSELETNLGSQLFNEYQKQFFEIYDGNSSQDVGVTCPNKKCNIRSLVYSGAEYATCQYCGYQFCISCLGNRHKGQTCEQAKQNLSDDEKKFLELAVNNFWKKCPTCGVWIQKNNGCNYMTCTSQKCNGSSFFCYICGQKLSKLDHFLHFRNLNGPFGNACINSKTIQKNKQAQSIKCPFCGVYDSTICEVQTNISNQICLCKSKRCQNKIFCLNCLQVLKEYDIFTHLERGCIKANAQPKICLIY